MEALLVPIADIIKRYVQINYLNFEDQQLNLAFYALLGISIALISKLIVFIFTDEDLIKKYKWYWEYKILKKENFICPVRYDTFINLYDTHKTNQPYKYVRALYNTDNNVFIKLVWNYIFKINDCSTYISLTKFHEMKMKDINDFRTCLPINDDNMSCIAYVNGFYIYVDVENLNREQIYFTSDNYESLVIFVNYIKKIYTEQYSTNLDKLVICEWKNNDFDIIGEIKEQLTMDNYVSKHKAVIVEKLEMIKNNKIENKYLENNLGIVVHGEYGTGKTFLISAIAHYLGRSICIINFTKIKTKTAFREIMKDCSKYVFCFDEIDYLLSDLILESKDEIKLQIQVLSSEISNCDDKDAKAVLIDKMKNLMEADDKLTYSFLLSELSGIASAKNRVIVATTNFIDRIPEALKRPGRFDMVLYLTYFTRAEIIELLINIYGKHNKAKIIAQKYIENKFTPAVIIFNSSKTLNEMIKFLTNRLPVRKCIIDD